MADVGGVELLAGPYLGEISALSFLHLPSRLPLLLAGSGSELLVYDVSSGDLLSSSHVFQGIRVHGISLCSHDGDQMELSFVVAVFGERRVKLFRILVGAAKSSVRLELAHRLPGFDHWVLDACLLKEDGCLAVGLSDNSIALWDMVGCNVADRVKSPDRCLLYSMRIWGNRIESLRVASGTIYNEIIVWRISPQAVFPPGTLVTEKSCNPSNLDLENTCLPDQAYIASHICRLTGHEGSIFRITWSADGSKLLSVSDDRSVRIWLVTDQGKDCGIPRETHGCHVSENLTLFGHNARIWDCHLTDSIIITAGEDCTCRVWGLDGSQLLMIKEHIGRGIWRCLYDPSSSLLITAGFDSAIKVHLLHSSLEKASEQNEKLSDSKKHIEVFTLSAPNVSKQLTKMDSNSEYVRCLQFKRENILYVATNNGYLHCVKLFNARDVRWTELACITEKGPIIFMDVIVIKSSKLSLDGEDLVAVGDGKGNATVFRVINGNTFPKVASSFTWEAEKDRQLLGIYWCESLGCSYLFTADPRGTLKLWNISNALQSNAENATVESKVFLAAVFTSCFETRIICLDASFNDEVLICGDQRGNLTMFPLSRNLIAANFYETMEKIPLLSYFKGAHGISSITGISVSALNNQVEIRTTGGDGCICYFRYDKTLHILEFTGMKQVKGLSTIQAVPTNLTSEADLAQCNYAIGFTSADFIMWNLKNETKVLQIPCGGWRRPYSYYIGAIPEYENCFAYLKDQTIHIHRLWVPVHKRQLFPQVLHIQFHGREIHSLCFILFGMPASLIQSCHSWIATGCEDGTVRLTRYMPLHTESWCASMLLGEHVGGSAVRSICFTSKIYYIHRAGQLCNKYGEQPNRPRDIKDGQLLLISVGAKQVLTCWLLQNKMPGNDEADFNGRLHDPRHISGPSTNLSSMSCQWLSTHMPSKFASGHQKAGRLMEIADQSDNDWRYLAVTAFQVKCVDSRTTICFIVVACSDVTLTLRALLLPHRLWFDVAKFVPQTSPVLALQHVALPVFSPTKDFEVEDAHIIISGSTDGSITFWEISETIECFMQFVSEFQQEMLIDCQRRPQTGRGSQGGRWWRSNRFSEKQMKASLSMKNGGTKTNGQNNDKIDFVLPATGEGEPCNNEECSSTLNSSSIESERSSSMSPFEIREIRPLYVLNAAHQSGVNCMHVSRMKDCLDSGMVYCVVSGGDDQALHCLAFDLVVPTQNLASSHRKPIDVTDQVQNRTATQPSGLYLFGKVSHSVSRLEIRAIYRDKITSAHSSSVKGIWTDGSWIFSTGLDQRVRCWQICHGGKLTEHAHTIIGVPEPEALSATISGGNKYQIAVAGRGIQMVEFCVPS